MGKPVPGLGSGQSEDHIERWGARFKKTFGALKEVIMAGVKEGKREKPASWEVDVLVAGGGVSGTAAAIAAARAGAKTLLVEATTGLMSSMGNNFFDEQGKIIVHGLGEEILDRVAARGGTSPGWKAPWVPKVPFDPEIFITVLEEMVTEAGAEVLFHTQVVSVAKTQGGKIKGVILENKSGPGCGRGRRI
jgi:flavin-dependent dehydrogenase